MSNYTLSLSNPEKANVIFEIQQQHLIELRKAGLISDSESLHQSLDSAFKLKCIEDLNQMIDPTAPVERKIEFYIIRKYADKKIAVMNDTVAPIKAVRRKLVTIFDRMRHLDMITEAQARYAQVLIDNWFIVTNKEDRIRERESAETA